MSSTIGFSRMVFLLASLLAALTSASPLVKRAVDDVVQGNLGSDAFGDENDGGANSFTNYIQYSGNGSLAAGWPSEQAWLSFNDLWVANQISINQSCEILYDVPNNSDQENQDLYDAIKQMSEQTRVDHRFILAVIMQETHGCVRAPTSVSPDGIRNPGLLQSFKGTHSCNDDDGKVQTPCPKDQILGMVSDGVAGTPAGHGYASDINDQAKVEDIQYAEAYYRAARAYNSGAIDASGDLGMGSATHCYSSDIANRLLGWVNTESTCTLDKVA